MLGYFSSDSVVGIYGFIATFAEGIGQIPVIVQINLNPILTRLAAEERMDEIRKLFRKTAVRIYPAMAGITVITLALFPFAVKWIAGDETFLEGHRWLGALLIGLTIAAGYTPFAKLLNQAGIPGKQTLMVTAILLSNVVLNFILIPKLGGMGAAVATSGAVVLGIFYLKLFVRRSISLRL
ncbi:MAG: polysaccharide biosynthesis C-terminal domain-containing protein [Planctomycetota bacterium]|jgi:O-antigen/teichoic acid export membrane protein|nr:polysaccharide biosynthesis C-terminal domain-containing protein [Planctomycetota bacterium]